MKNKDKYNLATHCGYCNEGYMFYVFIFDDNGNEIKRMTIKNFLKWLESESES